MKTAVASPPAPRGYRWRCTLPPCAETGTARTLDGGCDAVLWHYLRSHAEGLRQ